MKTRNGLTVGVATLAAAGAITGGAIDASVDQARGSVYVAAPPPPAPVVVAQPHYVWVEGQWMWNGVAGVWTPAHWLAVR